MKTAREIVDTAYTYPDAPNADLITAACQQIIAREAVRQTHYLRAILNRFDSLGADGIHTVIRDAAKRVNRPKRIKRAAA